MNVSKAKSLTINGQPVAKLQVGNVVIWEKGGEPENWELDEDGYIIGEDGKYYQRYFKIEGEGIYHPDIDLNEQWVEDTVSGALNIDENFDYYMSNSNYHVGGAYAQFKVTWSGLESITFLYRSYAESSYDYLVINGLDKPKFTSAPTSSTSGILAHTNNKQTTTYKTLTIDTPDKGEHFVWFCYRKDGSVDSDSDRAFIGVPNNIVKGELFEKQGAELRYDYVESTDYIIPREGYVQYKSYKTYYSPNGLNSFTTDDYILGEEVAATPVNHNYLHFDAVTNSAHIGFNNFSLISDLEYTTAFEETFAPFPSEGVDIQQGSTIWLRANGMSSYNGERSFAISQLVECHGDVRCLLSPTDFENAPLTSNCFNGLFYRTSITTPPELPATTLASACYKAMFAGCWDLKTPPELPATTLAVGCYSEMFNGCQKLERIPILSANILSTYCYNNMFVGCSKLSGVLDIPFLSSTYSYQFSRCINITSVNAENLLYLGYGCFSYCSSLKSISVPMLEKTSMDPFNGVKFSELSFPNLVSTEGLLCSGMSTLTSFYAPKLSYAGYGTFYGCSNLVSLSLPELTWIQNSCMQLCRNLKNIYAPKVSLVGNFGLTYISSELESLVLSDKVAWSGVTTPQVFDCRPIGQDILMESSALSESYMSSISDAHKIYLTPTAFLGASIVSGDWYGCGWSYGFVVGSNLTEINLPNCWYIEGDTPTRAGAKGYFAYAPSLTSVNIPNLEYLGGWTFLGDTGITSLSFSKLKYISCGALYNCSNLTEFNAPNVSYIDASAFGRCSALSQFYAPNLEYVGEAAFSGCSNLTEFYAPKLSVISDYCFNFCPLISINFPECKEIGRKAFFRCESLTGIVSLKNVTSIGESAFYGCSNVSSFNFENVLYVSSDAFRECTATEYNFPNVRNISSYAFRIYNQISNTIFRLDRLEKTYVLIFGRRYNTKIYMSQISRVPEMNGALFETDYGFQTAEFYVPSSLVDTFKTHRQWSSLASRIFPYEG